MARDGDCPKAWVANPLPISRKARSRRCCRLVFRRVLLRLIIQGCSGDRSEPSTGATDMPRTDLRDFLQGRGTVRPTFTTRYLGPTSPREGDVRTGQAHGSASDAGVRASGSESFFRWRTL